MRAAAVFEQKLTESGKQTQRLQANRVLTKYNLPTLPPAITGLEPTDRDPSKSTSEINTKLKSDQMEGLRTTHLNKPIQDTDKQATNKWLVEGKLDAQTEATIIAAQDEVLQTRKYLKEVTGKPENTNCRLCGNPGEMIGLEMLCASIPPTLGQAQ